MMTHELAEENQQVTVNEEAYVNVEFNEFDFIDEELHEREMDKN